MENQITRRGFVRGLAGLVLAGASVAGFAGDVEEKKKNYLFEDFVKLRENYTKRKLTPLQLYRTKKVWDKEGEWYQKMVCEAHANPDKYAERNLSKENKEVLKNDFGSDDLEKKPIYWTGRSGLKDKIAVSLLKKACPFVNIKRPIDEPSYVIWAKYGEMLDKRNDKDSLNLDTFLDK